MPHLAVSPADSEFDFDISGDLADAGFLSEDDSDTELENGFSGPVAKKLKISKEGLDASTIFNGGEGEGDDDEAFIAALQAASNRKASNLKGKKTVKKGGGFQTMGLSASLLKAISRKGFSVPTPIQRKTIPLLLDGQDVVGMARTGSGKTAAFVIPMIEKLKTHSIKVGAKALILSPSRELALQTLKVVKELGKGTDLKSVLLVGGDSMEDQFGYMTGNPDIIIATPGRFLHLKVEMNLDLKSIQYVVFDEADRLFEMGFSAQLTEILHALPPTRQTLLFSATLPKSLVEFAKAGLQEPSLVRLDADSKISQDLQSAFFTVKGAEKEGALLYILQDIIKIPAEPGKEETKQEDNTSQKRKRIIRPKNNEASSVSTIIFAATKHHVEYLARLISLAGYPVSYVYGSLDQSARRNQVARFTSGETNILVVTDVAARGIDIPSLANVINSDFPPQPKVFVHRVGRTARAGKRGWAYSLVRTEDAPYLLDLQLFLGRKLVFTGAGEKLKPECSFAQDVVAGSLPRDILEQRVELVNKFLGDDSELSSLREVAMKGEKLYQKTKASASVESFKRAKEVVKKSWMTINPLFADEVSSLEEERLKMLTQVSKWRPAETIFEIGQRGVNKSEAAEVMRKRRQKIRIKRKDDENSDMEGDKEDEEEPDLEARPKNEEDGDVLAYNSDSSGIDMDSASESDLASAFSKPNIPQPKISNKKRPKTAKASLDPAAYQDPEFFMSYAPTTTSLAEERGFALNSCTSFAEAARTVTFDLTTDEGGKGFAEPTRAKGLRWDKKSKKYVPRANDEDGSKGIKMIIGESGQKIAASFKSGKFEEWRRNNRISRLPRVGEIEKPNKFAQKQEVRKGRGGRMFHKKETAPIKPADKFRDDYKIRKKRIEEAKEKGLLDRDRAKNEVKNKDQIKKEMKLKQKRREKNNRSSRKGKGKR